MPALHYYSPQIFRDLGLFDESCSLLHSDEELLPSARRCPHVVELGWFREERVECDGEGIEVNLVSIVAMFVVPELRCREHWAASIPVFVRSAAQYFETAKSAICGSKSPFKKMLPGFRSR
jgi:hypothetical protein